MKNTKKEKEEEKRCAACVWRDRKTATPLVHCRAAYTRNENPGGTR